MVPRESLSTGETLDRVLAQYMNRVDCGEAVDQESVIAAHPRFSKELREFFENDNAIGALVFRPSVRSSGGSTENVLREVGMPFKRRSHNDRCNGAGNLMPDNPADANPQPDVHKTRLGDHELIREIGRGGMGVVYEARQILLNRRVALKVLPLEMALEERVVLRFQNEARAAAQLEHPNIVPVYEVGCDSSVHYFTMQYIEGCTLRQMIKVVRRDAKTKSPDSTIVTKRRTTSSEDTRCSRARTQTACLPTNSHHDNRFARTVAEWGIQAAEALHCAHQAGVIHRDVKPSNLLVDRSNKLWVADFGLARVQFDTSLTKSNQFVGTLPYMSPEQIDCEREVVDHRTDVYSLGVTLYEVLTGNKPFDGEHIEKIRARILNGPPTAPRTINPAVPADLEAVILKSMDKSPEYRYRTAQELADDLRRFLAGVPTLARRPNWFDHAARWVGRHRKLVAATILLLAFAVSALATSTILIAQAQSETQQALRAKEQALARSVRDRRRAEDMLEDFSTSLAGELDEIPGAEGMRRDLLKKCLAYYRDLIVEANSQPELRFDLAATHFRAGAILEEMGCVGEALAAYREAQRIFRDLTKDNPSEHRFQAALANCHNNIGLLLGRSGREGEDDDAIAELRRAINLHTELRRLDPSCAQYTDDLAVAYINFGHLEVQRGRAKEAERWYRAALDLREQLAKSEPDESRYLERLAENHNHLGLLFGNGRLEAAEDACQKSLTIYEELVASNGSHTRYLAGLGNSLNSLGGLNRRIADTESTERNRRIRLEAAKSAYQRAIDVRSRLTRIAPTVINHHTSLAVSQNNLAAVLRKSGRIDEAVTAMDASRRTLEDLVASYPEDTVTRAYLGGVLSNQGRILAESGRTEEAQEAFARGIEQQKQAVERQPSNVIFRAYLVEQYREFAQFLRDEGQLVLAEKQDVARRDLEKSKEG